MDFLLSKNEGNPLFCCKNGLNGGKPVKNRALLVWENRSTSKMSTQPTSYRYGDRWMIYIHDGRNR